jgi:hypothetical protein
MGDGRIVAKSECEIDSGHLVVMAAYEVVLAEEELILKRKSKDKIGLRAAQAAHTEAICTRSQGHAARWITSCTGNKDRAEACSQCGLLRPREFPNVLPSDICSGYMRSGGTRATREVGQSEQSESIC